ncbi:HmuY family protein [Bacteroides sp. 51]|uniref:HmuY family protein n=1 Tax=Bacteroides sp. 51 TaxID=2302938 RepID=UPI0013D835EF|nr:HmuY family protein [Bacteroides sp. 51]NDV83361.1 heme-containing protein HmuY [Bacteroides sp. 51]
MKLLKSLFIAAFAVLALTSCSDDDDKKQETGTTKTYLYVDATSYTDWTYFSFDKENVVEVTKPEDDLSWDIAFHRGDIRLNGGESGKGKGAAQNMNTTKWNEVTEAPTSGYVTDKVGKITTAFTGDGITEGDASFSQTLAGWLTIDTSNPPPVYTYHDWIYVIKTAAGKYVKIQITDYKNAKNAGAYISFKYQYNASGATSFE